MSNYSTNRGSRSARVAWIVTAIIAAIAVVAVVIVVVIANNNAPAPSPTDSKPTVSPTQSPTRTSTATPTVTPTPSPTPTVTPSPTTKPSGSSSPSPSPSPTTNPTIAWATSLYGTFAPLTAAGTGDSHVAVPVGVKGALLTVTNNGADDQEFQVEVYNQFGKSMSTLIDAMGDYQGTVAYGLTSQLGSTPTTILITSSGNWSIEFAPIASASMVIGSGNSDDVLLYGGEAGPMTVQSLTSGSFTLTTYSGNKPVANVVTTQTGLWTGQVDFPAGPLVLVVGSDGGWNLHVGVDN